MRRFQTLCLLLVAVAAPPALAADRPLFEPLDVFDLEWISDPRISPDGSQIVYVRNFMDVMKDRQRSNLWIAPSDGGEPRPLTTGVGNHSSPRWSPDGDRLLYASAVDGGVQLFVRWLDTGQTAQLTQLTESPGGLAWSPDGRWIALSLRVPDQPEPLATMPPKPKGAEWAPPARVIDRLTYRLDGSGYVEPGFTHLFVLPAEGGTPRQVTSGDYNHGSTPVWTLDGTRLIFSANRHPDAEYELLESEIYSLSLADGTVEALTDRVGPDTDPTLSPDGRRIAYLGYDDHRQGYQVTRLYVMDLDGSHRRALTEDFDRDVRSPLWSSDGRGIWFTYDDQGNGKVGYLPLAGGGVEVVADDLGLSLGRPYAGGQLAVGPAGRFAYTMTRPEHPADLVAGRRGGAVHRLTRVNRDLLEPMQLATVEEIRFESSHDGRPLQGWIAKPPGFDPGRRYPLLLEIHGGPFAAYGDRFSAEVQLYAAAGYVVLYLNPRGSTGYGQEFGNLIHHAYPSYDYDDLMSGVDALLARGYVDPERLFVTGGSGGGVLTAWIVGHTDRFRAAVVAKPVINWYSFVLTADLSDLFVKYWFPDAPWNAPEHYLQRSPLSYVGNVTTPTMLLTGEADYRTPISESEQFYQALKLRKIATALVRIPEASHGIANRPSHLIAKVQHVLAWFARYDAAPPTPSN